MADTQILNAQRVTVPLVYQLPESVELTLKAVNADFTDNGAATAWLPTVVIASDSGHVIARAVDQSVSVGAGDDAAVSWFPCVRHRGAAVEGPRCALLGSANGTATLTLTLTEAVPGPGVLHVVFCQATIGDATDTASAPSMVVDSQGVAGWVWATGTDPLIGLTREDLFGSGPPTTSQSGSVARPCTTGDLGIGDTITVTFTTTKPLLFHTAGLIVWQRAYFVTVKQFGFPTYGNNDPHPSAGASLTALSWDTDYGPGTAVPDKDAVMITAMGAYPAVAGFAPFVGSKIGEIASGSVSIAAACLACAEGATPDPGGAWPSAAIQLVGNYQFVEPRTFS